MITAIGDCADLPERLAQLSAAVPVGDCDVSLATASVFEIATQATGKIELLALGECA